MEAVGLLTWLSASSLYKMQNNSFHHLLPTTWRENDMSMRLNTSELSGDEGGLLMRGELPESEWNQLGQTCHGMKSRGI